MLSSLFSSRTSSWMDSQRVVYRRVAVHPTSNETSEAPRDQLSSVHSSLRWAAIRLLVSSVCCCSARITTCCARWAIAYPPLNETSEVPRDLSSSIFNVCIGVSFIGKHIQPSNSLVIYPRHPSSVHPDRSTVNVFSVLVMLMHWYCCMEMVNLSVGFITGKRCFVDGYWSTCARSRNYGLLLVLNYLRDFTGHTDRLTDTRP